VNPWFAKLNFSSAQATMRRLDKAFAAFFRRLQAGEKPGYPRFKVAGRYDSMEFPAYGDGIRLQEKLRIQHVGQVKVKQPRGIEGATQWALLTGASSGLGVEIARALAARRINLVLVARREAPMDGTCGATKTATRRRDHCRNHRSF
jgi:short subunit dehydrogenase